MAMKAPKLRFKPGSFVRDQNNQLYCIRIAFRLKGNPNEWMFLLEERKHMGDPSTPASTLIEQSYGGSGTTVCKAVYEPVCHFHDAKDDPDLRNMYQFGNGCFVSNRKMLNEFTVV